MSANTPLVQILSDTGERTVVKVTAWYNATALASNTIVVTANTLAAANSNRPCIISLTDVTYQCGLGTNTFASLQWVGGGSAVNTDILIFSGLSGGDFPFYISNPLAANSANLNGLAGDVNLQITNPAGNTSLSLVLTFIKEGGGSGGYANAYVGYNDPGFKA
jgi:hypothetical protein